MIEKREILQRAAMKGLPPSTLEKDYVLGWFLAAIDNHRSVSDSWAFKGGTCLKKCYFNDYRFSEDLDFSLLDPSQLKRDVLVHFLSDVADWLYKEVGLEIPDDGIRIDVYKNKRQKINAQARVTFCGPLRPKSKNCWPSIKFDLTEDEKIVFPLEKRNVFHSYSDQTDQMYANAYSIEEVFAEKLRALGDRCRPRDLYDVVMVCTRSIILTPQGQLY